MNKAAATLHFSEMLLSLLKGKTSLMDALRILSQEGIEKEVRESAIALLSVMKKGKNLSESLRLAKSGKVSFEPMYITLITAAEATGSIDKVLERIVNDLRHKQNVKDNVRGILVYPCIVITVAIAGTIVLITKGFPMFMENGLLREDFLSDAVSGIVMAGTVLLLGGGLLFIVYYRIFYMDSPEYSIFYILDFLLHNNIMLTEALSYCVLGVKNNKYAKAIVNIKKDTASGILFSTAFSRSGLFSSYVSGWLSVADSGGYIADICGNIRDFYEQKDNKIREIASKLIEPAIIVLTGLYILIIMLTVVMPVLTYTGGLL